MTLPLKQQIAPLFAGLDSQAVQGLCKDTYTLQTHSDGSIGSHSLPTLKLSSGLSVLYDVYLSVSYHRVMGDCLTDSSNPEEGTSWPCARIFCFLH